MRDYRVLVVAQLAQASNRPRLFHLEELIDPLLIRTPQLIRDLRPQTKVSDTATLFVVG